MTPGRFKVEWISAAEGDKYAKTLNNMQKVLDNIPPAALKEEIERLRPQMEQRARRMREVPNVEKALEFASRLRTIAAEEKEAVQ